MRVVSAPIKLYIYGIGQPVCEREPAKRTQRKVARKLAKLWCSSIVLPISSQTRTPRTLQPHGALDRIYDTAQC